MCRAGPLRWSTRRQEWPGAELEQTTHWNEPVVVGEHARSRMVAVRPRGEVAPGGREKPAQRHGAVALSPEQRVDDEVELAPADDRRADGPGVLGFRPDRRDDRGAAPGLDVEAGLLVERIVSVDIDRGIRDPEEPGGLARVGEVRDGEAKGVAHCPLRTR